MTGISIIFFVIAAVLIWGGLAVSVVFLMRQPEVAAYPAGNFVDDGDE